MPSVSQRTLDLYAQLPQYQRDADPTYGFPLLRYLSLLGDQSELTRSYLTNPAQLVDPTIAPYTVLPWLAMMLGVDYTLYPDTDGLRTDLRAAIAGAGGARRPGSDAAILNAVQPLLSGSRIAFIDMKNPAGFTFRVNVYDAQAGEQTQLQRVLDAVTPAGLQASINVIPGQTWGDVEDAGWTWGQIEDAGQTWDDLGSTIPDNAGRRTWAQVADRTWAQVEGSTWDQFSRQ
jgi:hypothetical protein